MTVQPLLMVPEQRVSELLNTSINFCNIGISKHKSCCAQSCGRCGGSNCQQLPGGRQMCCSLYIAKAGRICSSSFDVGCVAAKQAGLYSESKQTWSRSRPGAMMPENTSWMTAARIAHTARMSGAAELSATAERQKTRRQQVLQEQPQPVHALIREPFGLIVSAQPASSPSSLAIIRTAYPEELGDSTLLRPLRNLFRVSIEGADVATHSLDVFSISEQEEVLLWRTSFPVIGVFNVTVQMDMGNCSSPVASGPHRCCRCNMPHNMPRATVAVRVTHRAHAVSSRNLKAHAVFRRLNCESLSDLSSGWWQSRDGLPVYSSNRLEWRMPCKDWAARLLNETVAASKTFTLARRRVILVGDSNTVRVGANWNDRTKMTMLDTRPIDFLMKTYKNMSYRDAKASIHNFMESPEFLSAFHADFAKGVHARARNPANMFVIGANAHFDPWDRNALVAIMDIHKRGSCVVLWSQIDAYHELLPPAMINQREMRSSWYIEAANQEVRNSGLPYIDAFSPSLAFHHWRLDVVHLNRPNFARAFYADLMPTLIIAALYHACPELRPLS